MAIEAKGKDKCWLCDVGNIVETIEENFKVDKMPSIGTVTLPKARVGRCDHCHGVLYALRIQNES